MVTEWGIIGIAFFDLVGNITDANDEFLKLLGYSREDLHARGLRWDAVIPDDWRNRTSQAGKDLKATGRLDPHELEFLRRDGSRIPVLLGGALVSDSRCGVAFLLDITERKLAEQGCLDYEFS